MYKQAKIVLYKNRRWIKCPYCGNLLFPVEDDTSIQNLAYYCKKSICKRTMIINVEPLEPIEE